MHSYRSLVDQARSLEKERGISLDFTDKNIADSWVRCFEHGLRPNANPVDTVLNQKELESLIRNPVLIISFFLLIIVYAPHYKNPYLSILMIFQS